MRSIIGDEFIDKFVDDIRVEMAHRGHTRKTLADASACKDRAIGKLLAGEPVHNNTIAKVARVLGLDIANYRRASGEPTLVSPPPEPIGRRDAEDLYGGYSEHEVSEFFGTFIGYRRVFSDERRLHRSAFEFRWSDTKRRLEFFESQRYSPSPGKWLTSSHAGGVYISRRTRLVHRVTRFQGAVRLMTLHLPRIGEGLFRGVVLTQSERPLFYIPSVSAIFLQKLDEAKTNSELEQMTGSFGTDDPEFEYANAELISIEKNALHISHEAPEMARPHLAVSNTGRGKK